MIDRLRQALASRNKLEISGLGLTEAAVLIPIFCRDGEYHILFTQRSEQVPTHKGQISFPGGARSNDDATLRDTALRESQEEIGLKPKDADIIGELDDTPTTTSGFNISPFVFLIPYPYNFKLSPFEIKEIFSVPIEALIHKAKKRKEQYIFGKQVFTGYSYEYQGRVIWGATAKIVQQLLEIWESASQS
ncbi:MAG TPA: CoA pyrophosphatase [Dehalococcoidia bacterium]|jgi:8-oxo-dGTP pyrophosphatase MutT (NUDIX family)